MDQIIARKSKTNLFLAIFMYSLAGILIITIFLALITKFGANISSILMAILIPTLISLAFIIPGSILIRVYLKTPEILIRYYDNYLYIFTSKGSQKILLSDIKYSSIKFVGGRYRVPVIVIYVNQYEHTIKYVKDSKAVQQQIEALRKQ